MTKRLVVWRKGSKLVVVRVDEFDFQLPPDLIARHRANLLGLGDDASCGVVREPGLGEPPPAFKPRPAGPMFVEIAKDSRGA